MIVSGVAGANQPPQAPAAPAGPNAPDAPARRADAEALRKAVAAARAVLKPVANSLEFTVDDSSGRTIVRVFDTETQQLIRQIPSKEMVEIARVLERLQGILLNDRA